ncbi:MAG: ankyrin repeat domain-containing protein [Gemmatimonadales bacterium]|nr:ankyrin repeat domain-containing protein [Gemmatimonadales bacterium]
MPARDLPVRPDLDQLHRQAKEFLKAIHAGDAAAIAEWRELHPEPADPAAAKLAEAQRVLAKSYRASSWPRLVVAVELVDGIWRDDRTKVLSLVDANPALLHETVLLRPDSNWGPPMSYAANLGRDELIRQLHARGARDLEKAAGRAALQGHPGTVQMIYDLAGRPPVKHDSLAGPAYTLNVPGTAVLFSLGVRADGPNGVEPNVMEHLLGTDSRNPAAKHRILEMYVEHGFEPSDTPIMAFHRGRLDLLEAHLLRDPQLLTRTFPKAAIFPMAPACAAGPYTAQGTPLEGATLLHIAAYFDDVEIGEWLLDRGMDPNVPAAIDADGFGGYTSLFSTVVSQRNFWVNYGSGQPDEARFTRLLLDRGADPNVRASIRAQLEEGHGGGPIHEVRGVTPLGWGEQYHARIFVSRESMRLVEERGGGR